MIACSLEPLGATDLCLVDLAENNTPLLVQVTWWWCFAPQAWERPKPDTLGVYLNIKLENDLIPSEWAALWLMWGYNWQLLRAWVCDTGKWCSLLQVERMYRQKVNRNDRRWRLIQPKGQGETEKFNDSTHCCYNPSHLAWYFLIKFICQRHIPHCWMWEYVVLLSI